MQQWFLGGCLIWEGVAQTLICTYSTRHVIRVHLNSSDSLLAYFKINEIVNTVLSEPRVFKYLNN